MKIIDFYSGFEGSPEIIISVGDDSGNATFTLRTWIGYFDAVLQRMEPVNGNWLGISLFYHLETGWYEEEWECDDLSLLNDQLIRIEKDGFDLLEKKFSEEFQKIVKYALDNKKRLFIRYE